MWTEEGLGREGQLSTGLLRAVLPILWVRASPSSALPNSLPHLELLDPSLGPLSATWSSPLEGAWLEAVTSTSAGPLGSGSPASRGTPDLPSESPPPSQCSSHLVLSFSHSMTPLASSSCSRSPQSTRPSPHCPPLSAGTPALQGATLQQKGPGVPWILLRPLPPPVQHQASRVPSPPVYLPRAPLSPCPQPPLLHAPPHSPPRATGFCLSKFTAIYEVVVTYVSPGPPSFAHLCTHLEHACAPGRGKPPCACHPQALSPWFRVRDHVARW